MKNLRFGAVILTAITTTPAMAQVATSQDASYAVTGSVQTTCGTIAGEPLEFGQLQINANGTLGSNGAKSHSQATYCNGAGARVKVNVTPMTTAGTAPDGFTNQINFTATVSLAGTSVPTNGSYLTVGPINGDLDVQASDLQAEGGALPMAGSYSGEIKVTLSPTA